jgi:hypothetical protein
MAVLRLDPDGVLLQNLEDCLCSASIPIPAFGNP